MGGHSDTVNAAAFSPTGEYLVSGSEDRTIKLWEVATGRELATWDNELPEYSKPYQVYALTFSASGKSVISGSNDYAVKVWDIQKGSVVRDLREPSLEKEQLLTEMGASRRVASNFRVLPDQILIV